MEKPAETGRRRALRVACRETATVITIYTTVYDYFRNARKRSAVYPRGGMSVGRFTIERSGFVRDHVQLGSYYAYLPRRFAARYRAADDTVPAGLAMQIFHGKKRNYRVAGIVDRMKT